MGEIYFLKQKEEEIIQSQERKRKSNRRSTERNSDFLA